MTATLSPVKGGDPRSSTAACQSSVVVTHAITNAPINKVAVTVKWEANNPTKDMPFTQTGNTDGKGMFNSKSKSINQKQQNAGCTFTLVAAVKPGYVLVSSPGMSSSRTLP
jgi:hypothetical protein